jgi:hypothetical protein
MADNGDDDDLVLLDQRPRKAGGKRTQWLQRKPRSLKRFAETSVGAAYGEDLPSISIKSALGRRYGRAARDLIVDAGGVDRCSAMQLALLRRVAACIALAEQAEIAMFKGEKVNVIEYVLFCGIILKTARLIGTSRVPKELPSLEEYLANLKGRDGDAAQEVLEGEVNGAADDDADSEL